MVHGKPRRLLQTISNIAIELAVVLALPVHAGAPSAQEPDFVTFHSLESHSNESHAKETRPVRTGKSDPARASKVRYVSVSGSNSANCTNETTDACTFARADALARPGWTIRVAPGTYTRPVYLTSSGTMSKPITWISDAKWAAKIIVTSSSDSCFYATGNYVTVDGFEISEDSSGGTCRIGLRLDGAHVVARHNYIHDLNKHDAIIHCGRLANPYPNNNNNGAAGILVTSQPSGSTHEYAIVDANIVDNIGGLQPHHAEHDCPYVASYYLSMSHMLATNNISLRAEGYSFSMGGHTPSQPVYDQLLINNAAIADGYGAFYLDCDVAGCVDYAFNNIVDERWSAGIVGFGGTSDTSGCGKVSNNLVYMPRGGNRDGNLKACPSYPQTWVGTTSTNPLFLRYTGDATGDYHLQSGSPAIDRGTSLNAPSTDFDGTPRPQQSSYDVGAFEFAASQSQSHRNASW